MQRGRFIVVMGVSGCGKTTVGSALADKLEGVYLEGDAYHTEEAKDKMGRGIPLSDEDRWPWFDRLIAAASQELAQGQDVVLACSALKKDYRDYLFREGPLHNYLAYLQGSFSLIKQRMDDRNHEYMTSDLLRSQFDTLEEPQKDEKAQLRIISIAESPDEIVSKLVQWLG